MPSEERLTVELVVGQAHRGEGDAMVARVSGQDDSLISRDTLLDVCPLASNLQGRISGFRTTAHGGHGVITVFLYHLRI